MNKILCIATKRSIHHSCLSWLLQQTPYETQYLCDDSVPHTIVPKHYDAQESSDSVIVAPYRFDYSKEMNEIFDRAIRENKRLIINIEGVTESKIEPNKKYLPDGVDKENFQNIIILREAYNCLCSCLHLGDVYYQIEDVKEAWKSQAKEILGDTHHLGGHYPILADRWFLSKEYRKQICQDLGLTFTDKGIQRVANNAGGSRFSGRQYDGKAQQMDILNRWKKCANNPRFLSVINDEELIEMNDTLFRDMYGGGVK